MAAPSWVPTRPAAIASSVAVDPRPIVEDPGQRRDGSVAASAARTGVARVAGVTASTRSPRRVSRSCGIGSAPGQPLLACRDERRSQLEGVTGSPREASSIRTRVGRARATPVRVRSTQWRAAIDNGPTLGGWPAVVVAGRRGRSVGRREAAPPRSRTVTTTPSRSRSRRRTANARSLRGRGIEPWSIVDGDEHRASSRASDRTRAEDARRQNADRRPPRPTKTHDPDRTGRRAGEPRRDGVPLQPGRTANAPSRADHRAGLPARRQSVVASAWRCLPTSASHPWLGQGAGSDARVASCRSPASP